MAPALISRLAAESGLQTLLAQPRSTHLLCVSRFIRMFAYGTTALILALFLSSLDVSDTRIGAFMTATLVGDVVISYVLTIFADALGRRRVLTIGSALMVVSGAVFAVSGNYWVLVMASIVGVISPSGNEIGPFKAIEESTLAQLCADKSVRSDVFAWYNLIGSAGAACGQISCGWAVQALEGRPDWTARDAYRIMFVVYAGVGGLKTGLSLLLGGDCEVVRVKKEVQMGDGGEAGEGLLARDEPEQHKLQDVKPGQEHDARSTTSSPPLPETPSPILTPVPSRAPSPPSPTRTAPPLTLTSRLLATFSTLVPKLSPRSQHTVLRLSALFFTDSFASGLVSLTWTSYYFSQKFAPLPPSTLGTIFSTASFCAAISNLFAAALAKRIGLVRTMVYTHLPSAICLMLIPASPRLAVAAAFLWLRACTSTMDGAPRQAFLSQAVLSAERTAVMGVVNVVKTGAQSVGPSVTGWLAGRGFFWVAFVAAGALKAGYDLGMLAMFQGFKAPEEE